MIGYYIVEYEQHGKSRAEYGINKYPQICASVSHKFETPPDMLIGRLSFSHIREIMAIDDPFELFFYEFECIKGTWSVRELRRHISTSKRINLRIRSGTGTERSFTGVYAQVRQGLLHCNVIIELKNEEFSHENLGQLNAYVGYYKENEMYPGDNPPVGILLCTKKGKKMAEYALSGLDNRLFVSQYMLQLPDKKQLENFLIKQMDELGME